MKFVRMLILAFGLACVAVPAFAFDPGISYSRIEGTVVEEGTGKPVAGAHVLVVWKWHFGTHSSSSGCANSDATITDANGRFALHPSPASTWAKVPALSSNPLIGSPDFIIYSRGHSFGFPGYGEGRVMSPSDDYEIQKKRGLLLLLKSAEVTTRVDARGTPAGTDSHERLRELYVLSQPLWQCESAIDRARVLRFFEAMAEEARAIARTDYESRLASAISLRARTPLGNASRPLLGMDALALATAGNGPADIDARSVHDQTQLMRSALGGDFAGVRSLLEMGANPNRTTFSGEGINYGYSALTQLIHAIGYADTNRSRDADRHVRMIALLLADRRTDPNWRKSSRDYTPLLSAAARVQDDVVKLLLDAGADPTLKTGSDTALLLAERRAGYGPLSEPDGRTAGGRTVRLLRLVANRGPEEMHVALLRAIDSRDPAAVRALIGNQGPPDPGLPPRFPPPLLHATFIATLDADSKPAVEIVRILARYPGKDTLYQGKTARQLAREAGRKDLIELLK